MKTLIIAVIMIACIFSQNVFPKQKIESSLQDITGEYLNLKNELANDNSSGASTAAAKLLDVVKNFQLDNISSDGYKVWKKYSAKLEMHTKQISESNEIEQQREDFMSLSSDLYKVLISFKENTDVLYYQFCPMANDGKGAYWISETSKIKNPYFGKSMLSCGETKSTLEPKK